MTIMTVTSREFNQDVSRIKHAALKGPVFITDRGQPAHVLLSIQEYEKLTAKKVDIVDLIGMSDAAYVDFEPVIWTEPVRFEEFE